MNKFNELKKITGIIEDKYGKYRTNTGYRINEVDYIYGGYILEKGINIDIDGDKIENNLLYVWIDDEYYKVINEDIEDL